MDHTLRTNDLDSEKENMLNLKAVDKDYGRLWILFSRFKVTYLFVKCSVQTMPLSKKRKKKKSVPGPALSFFILLKFYLKIHFSSSHLNTSQLFELYQER